MRKYKLTEESKIICGIRFYRIEALRKVQNVLKGDKGGWIEKEINLSQFGEAWIYGDARISGDVRISGDTRIFGDVWIR